MNSLLVFAVSGTLLVAACFVLYLTIKYSTKGFIIFGIIAFSVSTSIYIAILNALINNQT